MSEIHRDRELEHLENIIYSYKVENKSLETENKRFKQEIYRLMSALTRIKEHAMQRDHHVNDIHADYFRLSAKALEGE